MASGIAILGWGSLLWDERKEFDLHHDEWFQDGPVLKLEFSRISSSRNGALTLVIDPKHGAPVVVAYCLSKRTQVTEVVEDLQLREGTNPKYIGYINSETGDAESIDKESANRIRAWALEHDLAGAAWTDLQSNFEEKRRMLFSVEEALAYLNSLEGAVKENALNYIEKAPSFVQTPLRTALRL